jgi:hypothetical protein
LFEGHIFFRRVFVNKKHKIHNVAFIVHLSIIKSDITSYMPKRAKIKSLYFSRLQKSLFLFLSEKSELFLRATELID